MIISSDKSIIQHFENTKQPGTNQKPTIIPEMVLPSGQRHETKITGRKRKLITSELIIIPTKHWVVSFRNALNILPLFLTIPLHTHSNPANPGNLVSPQHTCYFDASTSFTHLVLSACVTTPHLSLFKFYPCL